MVDCWRAFGSPAKTVTRKDRKRKQHNQEDKEKRRDQMKMDFLKTCKSGTESTKLQLQRGLQGLTNYLRWLWWAATDQKVALAVAVATAQAATEEARLTKSSNHSRERYAVIAIQLPTLKGV